MKAKNKKIAIFHCGFIYSGGGERLIIEEAKGFLKKGYEVDIFVPTYEKQLCFPDELKGLSVKTFLPQLPNFIPLKHAFEMVFSSLLAPFFANRFKSYDFILGANQPGAWIAYCVTKITKIPYVVYFNQPNRLLYPRDVDRRAKWRDIKDYYYLDGLINFFKSFVAWADRVSLEGARQVLVNGDYIGKLMREIYNVPVEVCPAGAKVQSFDLLRVNPHTAYVGEFEIKNMKGERFKVRKPYILITNRHQPQKRFDYGFLAFDRVRQVYPDLHLYIPGPFTSETVKLKEMIEGVNMESHIVFTGQISEKSLQKLYREAVVYWYTAPEEDFGMGVIEAMGWGVPVVAWNHAGPTVTVEDGKTGYLAKPYDIEDFAKKTVEAIKVYEDRAEMGKRAWKRVKDKFSWDRHVDIIERAMFG